MIDCTCILLPNETSCFSRKSLQLPGPGWSSLRCWSWTSWGEPAWPWPPAGPWCAAAAQPKCHWSQRGGNQRPRPPSEEQRRLSVAKLPNFSFLFTLFLNHDSFRLEWTGQVHGTSRNITVCSSCSNREPLLLTLQFTKETSFLCLYADDARL